MRDSTVRGGYTYRLYANDGVRVCLAHTCDELILPSGNVERGPVETFALPLGRQPGDDDHDVGFGGKLDCGFDRSVRVDLLAASKTLSADVNASH